MAAKNAAVANAAKKPKRSDHVAYSIDALSRVAADAAPKYASDYTADNPGYPAYTAPDFSAEMKSLGRGATDKSAKYKK
ncbi:MAG: hypothetical protein LBP79_00795 [Clostridiales bacterium]|nr:hypothetical protein [Clostridiales bacterium]